jgi:NCS1 family nucleobase:cation symporter-1
MILVIVPMLPALANKVTPENIHIPKELSNLFTINWLSCFVAPCVLYSVLNVVFPDSGTLIPRTIQGNAEVVEGRLVAMRARMVKAGPRKGWT